MNDPRNVLLVNDVSGLGNCSIGAALPILTAMGHHAIPIVTGAFSCQTGFAGFRFVDNPDIAEFIKGVLANCTLDAALTGFTTGIAQLRDITQAADELLKGSTFLLVDPIMGDNGKYYPLYGDSYGEEMKKLVRGADVITPNLTEACLLTDADYGKLTANAEQSGYLNRVKEIFADVTDKLQVGCAVITGIDCGSYIANLITDGQKVSFVTNDKVDIRYSGTGDVFSATLLGAMLLGADVFSACRTASSFVYQSILATKSQDPRHGINIAATLGKLIR